MVASVYCPQYISATVTIGGMSLLFITFPIFLLIALGYVLRSWHGITRNGIHALNGFVYFISLPAVILISFWGIDWFDEQTRWVLLTNTVAVVGFALVLPLLLRILPFAKRIKAGIFVSALVGNTVYMGFPIGERALGESLYDIFLAAATPHLAIGIAVSIIAIEWYVLKSHDPLRYIKDFALNPLILALAGGIALSVLNVSGELVELIKQPITMLAATASPIALVTLGAFLHGAFKFKLAGYALIATTRKLLILPATIYIVGQLFALDAVVVSASVLATAMPTAVTSFVIAERYNAAPELVATTLFMSTVCSLGTITALLFFLL